MKITARHVIDLHERIDIVIGSLDSDHDSATIQYLVTAKCAITSGNGSAAGYYLGMAWAQGVMREAQYDAIQSSLRLMDR